MPLPRRFLAVSALALLASPLVLVASCGAPSAPAPQEHTSYTRQGIMGGTDDTGDPNVVGIAIIAGWSGGLCSGSLIAPNLILTARHCVSSVPTQIDCSTATFGSTYSANSFEVTTIWNAPATFMYSGSLPGTSYKVDQVTVPSNNKVCGNDVALIRLKGAGIPASEAQPIVPRVDKVVDTGEAYRAVGFGATNDTGSGAGQRRQLGGLAVSCSVMCPAFYMAPQTEWEGDHGICEGDSGGPALDAQNRVIGVVSRGGTNCTSPIYGSVYGWADWIKQNALAAAQAGGYQPAPWVTGGATGSDIDGGAAGSGGGGGSGGSTGVPGGPGAPCSVSADCQSQVCVFEDSNTQYCSERCSADNTTCPPGMVCSTSVGACFLPGGFAATCQSGADCRSGVCVTDGNGHLYCSQYCDTNNPVCPDNSTCSGEPAACYQPPSVVAASGQSSGCSVSNAPVTDPTKPIPWIVGFGVLGLLALRRRRS